MTAQQKIEAATIVPEWTIEPSPFDWQIMLFGGVNPRNGIEWLPLEFQYFGKFYSPKQIQQKARDLLEWHKREHFIIREPTDPRFMRKACDLVPVREAR